MLKSQLVHEASCEWWKKHSENEEMFKIFILIINNIKINQLNVKKLAILIKII